MSLESKAFPVEWFEDLERWIVERSAKGAHGDGGEGCHVDRARPRARGRAETRMSNVALVREPGSTEPGSEPPVTSLTRRELVVLENLAKGATLEEIASKLWVSRNTVKSQVRSVYRKIGVCTRADAVAWAESEAARLR